MAIKLSKRKHNASSQNLKETLSSNRFYRRVKVGMGFTFLVVFASLYWQDDAFQPPQSPDSSSQERPVSERQATSQPDQRQAHGAEPVLVTQAKQGDASAQYALGMRYLRGEGVSQNLATASRWLTQAANEGHLDAQMTMGLLYEKGAGVPKSESAAALFYRMAADNGDSEAAYRAGNLLMYAYNGNARQPEVGLDYLHQAAESGHAKAAHLLGMFYNHRSLTPSQDDYQRAAYWYQASAEQGEMLGQRDLGSLYFSGQGVDKNLDLAVHWHIKAAEQGSIIALQYLEKASGMGSPKARQWLRNHSDVAGNIRRKAGQGSD